MVELRQILVRTHEILAILSYWEGIDLSVGENGRGSVRCRDVVVEGVWGVGRGAQRCNPSRNLAVDFRRVEKKLLVQSARVDKSDPILPHLIGSTRCPGTRISAGPRYLGSSALERIGLQNRTASEGPEMLTPTEAGLHMRFTMPQKGIPSHSIEASFLFSNFAIDSV